MNIAQQPSPDVRLHFLDYWRVIKMRKAIVFVVFLLVMLVVATVTYFQPKIYQAAVRLQVEQEKPAVAVFENQAVPAYDPYFLQTQYEIIQSKKVLYPVIEKLKLHEQWGGPGVRLPLEVAFNQLKGRLGVRRYRDTSLIEIVVEDQKPAEAARIANTIADTFRDVRMAQKREEIEAALQKLRVELEERRKEMEAAQAKVEELRRDLKVPVFGSVKLSDQTIVQLEQQWQVAKQDVVGRETRLNELKKLNPQQLRNAIATIFSEPNVQSLLQNLTDTELRLEVLKQDFGPDHPSVRAVLAQRDKLDEQLNARLDGIMKGYEVDLRMAQQRRDEMQRQLDELKQASLVLDSEAFLPYRNAQQVAESKTRIYEALNVRLQQTMIDLQSPRTPIKTVDDAEPPLGYVRPRLTVNLTLGALFGLVLGVALAFFIEFLDTSVKIMEDVEQYLGLPVLGVIPQGTLQLSDPKASPAHLESYRMLRTNIDFSEAGADKRSFAVLSAGAGEGKSFTLANLAYVFAQQDARVLIVDSDLRRPTAHKYWGLDRENGLSDYLTGAKKIDDIIQPTKVPNISLIPAGAARVARTALPLLTSQRMNQLIKEASHRFDVVLYDTPPVLGISDAVVVAREVGNAILVVQHRRFPRAMSLRARKMVEKSGGKLLGVVVNNIHVGHEDTYYYYHDHYEHYLRGVEVADEPKKAQPAAAARRSDAGIDLQDKY